MINGYDENKLSAYAMNGKKPLDKATCNMNFIRTDASNDKGERTEAFITKVVSGIFYLAADGRNIGAAKARGLMKHQLKRLQTGDEVVCYKQDDAEYPWLITEMKSRKNQLKRPPLSNLDELWLVVSLVEPVANLKQIDQVICQAKLSGIDVRIILTKSDLALSEDELLREQTALYPAIDAISSSTTTLATQLATYFAPVFPTTVVSSKQGELGSLPSWSQNAGLKVALSGLSGVGKSSLLNALAGTELMLTASLSKKSGRGKQTTRHAEFFKFGDMWLADTPGFSVLDLSLWKLDAAIAKAAYPDLEAYAGACYFNDCLHLHEPKCAVKKAAISPWQQQRLNNYQNFVNYLKELQRN